MIDTNKELRKNIAELLRKFSMDPHHSPLENQKDREIVGRFIDRLHSTEFDTGGLPYYSKNGLAKHSNKAECLFALVCDVVLDYWEVAKNEGVKAKVWTESANNKLKVLETVYSNYSTLKVLGDAKGYCLFASQLLKPKKEDTDGSKEVESKPASQEVSQEKTAEGTDQPVNSEEAQIEPMDTPVDIDGGTLIDDADDMSLGEEQALRGGGAL